MNNEIIVVKQLPIIEEQLAQVKALVTAKTDEALSYICTEDTVKDIKKMRAELNAELKQWESKRIEIKKAVLSPYERFESVYKDCVSDVYKSADIKLKEKIDSVENELKEQKRKEVFYYFEELCEANGLDFLTFERSGINVTLSASLKSLKEQVKTLVDRVCSDLALIDTQEHSTEILVEYKQSLNVSAAITSVVNRYKAIEAEKAREEERRQREQAAAEAVARIEAAVDEITPPTPITPPVEEEPVLTLRFTVRGTRSKLRELKDYLERNGYDYE